MNQQELEDVFIRSLDVPMSAEEKEQFLNNLTSNAALAKELAKHKKIRELIRANEPATFGPYFANKLVLKIQNTGVVIDRQVFAFFKKFQLAALGVVVALLILNVAFAEHTTIKAILGFENTTDTEEEIASFDFYETLTNDL